VLDIRDVDVQKAFTTFNTMQKLAPIAGLAKGKISTQLSLKTDLDGNMMPVYSSIMGDGNLKSQMLTFSNVKSFNKIADALKMDKLKEWVIEKVNLSFEVIDGKVFVKPFETAVGGAANNVLNNLVSEANKKGANFSAGDVIPIAVLITGTVRDPKVSTDLKGMASNVIDDMKKQITETIQEKKEEAVAKVREEAGKYLEEANLRAQKLLDEAQKQSDEIMRIARESAASVKAESDKRADQLIAEGKKSGMIAEIAAKKAAEETRKQGNKQADNIVAEAQKQADNVMAKARQESDKIVQEAKDKAAGN